MKGEKHAWERLGQTDGADVCVRAGVTVDDGVEGYCVPFFGQHVYVVPGPREFRCDSPTGGLLLDRFQYFSRISILQYLIHAQPTPLSGKLVATSELNVGQSFFEGSHALPLSRLAAVYENDLPAFVERAGTFGGQAASGGDVAVRLPAFPRLPVFLLLWGADDEFAGRASLLLDESCETHVPADIVWSVAMLSVLAML